MTIRYVNTASTAGGDGTTNATTGANRAYATLAEAETALQAVLTEDMNILCAGATADARTTFDGWTAGSFRIYIKGNPDDAAGVHAGIWDVNKYRITAASGTLATLEIIEDSVTVSRIQLTTTHLDGMAVGRAGPVGLAFIADSLVLKGSGTTSGSIGAALADLNNTNVKVRNCIAYDWVIGIYVRQEAAGAGDSFIVNNTAHSCGTGIRAHDNTSAAAYIQAWNNLSVGNTSDWVDTNSGFDLTNSGNNAYRNTAVACPGSTDINLSTYVDADIFVDAANDNFHLLTTGSAYALIDNDGIGPASNAEVPTTDIDSDARSGTATSVGADIVIAAGGDTALNSIIRSAAVVSTSLLTAISLLGSTLGSTSIQASLSTSISIASAPTARATVASELVTAIPLGTTVSARSNIYSGLSTSIPIETAVSARATVSTGLSTSIPLTAAVAARSQTASNLTTEIPLASVTSASATLVASFEAQAADLGCAVQARTITSGSLSTSISLTSPLIACASLVADISTGIPLASSLFAATDLQSDLSIVTSPLAVTATHTDLKIIQSATHLRVSQQANSMRIKNG